MSFCDVRLNRFNRKPSSEYRLSVNQQQKSYNSNRAWKKRADKDHAVPYCAKCSVTKISAYAF